MAIRAVAMFDSIPGSRYAETAGRPRSSRRWEYSSKVSSPPPPVAAITAIRCGSTSRPTSIPASASASSAAASARTTNRSTQRVWFGGRTDAGSMSGAIPMISSVSATGCFSGGAPRPVRPAHTSWKTSCAPRPSGLTRPRPVTAARSPPGQLIPRLPASSSRASRPAHPAPPGQLIASLLACSSPASSSHGSRPPHDITPTSWHHFRPVTLAQHELAHLAGRGERDIVVVHGNDVAQGGCHAFVEAGAYLGRPVQTRIGAPFELEQHVGHHLAGLGHGDDRAVEDVWAVCEDAFLAVGGVETCATAEVNRVDLAIQVVEVTILVAIDKVSGQEVTANPGAVGQGRVVPVSERDRRRGRAELADLTGRKLLTVWPKDHYLGERMRAADAAAVGVRVAGMGDIEVRVAHLA